MENTNENGTKRQLELADERDWDGLDSAGWCKLLARHPELADKCDQWNAFDGEQFARLLSVSAAFAERRTAWNTFTVKEWHGILRVAPELFGKCDIWKDLNKPASGWKKLVEAVPQIKRLWDARKKGEDVVCYKISIRRKAPESVDETISRETIDSLADLLGPDKANVLAKMNGSDWARLLISQPGFGEKADLAAMMVDDWDEVLKVQPQLAKYRPPADCMDFSKLDGAAWAGLLSKHPEFADRCDWEKLDGNDWCELLKRRPEFADLCDWDKANRGCLKLKRELLLEHPGLIDRCAWNLDRCDWLCLFQAHPELMEKHPQVFQNFDEFTGSEWTILLQVPAIVNRLQVEAIEIVKATKPSAPKTRR